MPKIKYTKKDWNTAKKLFIEGIPLSRIEVLTGIPEDYLKQKRSKEGWVGLKNNSKKFEKAVKEQDFEKIEESVYEACDREGGLSLIEEIISIKLNHIRSKLGTDVDEDMFLAKNLKSFAQTYQIINQIRKDSPTDDEEEDNAEVEEEDLSLILNSLTDEQKEMFLSNLKVEK
jgi:hypothetical protein